MIFIDKLFYGKRFKRDWKNLSIQLRTVVLENLSEADLAS